MTQHNTPTCNTLDYLDRVASIKSHLGFIATLPTKMLATAPTKALDSIYTSLVHGLDRLVAAHTPNAEVTHLQGETLSRLDLARAIKTNARAYTRIPDGNFHPLGAPESEGYIGLADFEQSDAVGSVEYLRNTLVGDETTDPDYHRVSDVEALTAAADEWRLKDLAQDEDAWDGLYDAVHDAASRMASAANNGGVEAQIEFLRGQGWTDREILACAKG